MKINYEEDRSLPRLYSTLSDWRTFIAELLGKDSAAHAYIERLCYLHGADYVVETEPNAFLEHVGRVAFTNDREGAA